MKNRSLAVILAAAMSLGLAACGSESKPAASPSASDAKPAGSEAAAQAPVEDLSSLKIGLVTDVGGVNDQSFNQSAWEGLTKFGEDTGATVNYVESKNDTDYAPNIEILVDDEYDLIICVGYMLADAVKEAAANYPDQKFAIIDDASNADLANVECLCFKQQEASYLVGLVAGMTTESNNIGFVLGNASENMHLFGYGYLAGAIDANPDVTVQQYNAASFSDAAGGKSAANSMITNGADIIYHAAAATGIGVIEACAESGKYAIGVDIDQAYLSPEAVLTSAMKRVDVAVYKACTDFADGTFTPGVQTFELSNGGVDIAPTTDNISEDVLKAVEEAKAKVVSGEIKVPNNKEEFEAAYGDVYVLD